MGRLRVASRILQGLVRPMQPKQGPHNLVQADVVDEEEHGPQFSSKSSVNQFWWHGPEEEQKKDSLNGRNVTDEVDVNSF